FSISTYELDATDRCYTVDTLAHFKAELGTADLFFLMGADSFAEITSWHEWERLLVTVNHIVVTRPGYVLNSKSLSPSLAERIVDVRGKNSEQIAAPPGHSADERIFITDGVLIDVSATGIRRAVKEKTAELTTMV